jgi:NCS1 family nucleobase:cation symporter-1
MSSNVLNIYSGSLSAITFDFPVKRWTMAILIGCISIVLSLIIGYGKFAGFFQNWLLFLGYWITPWLGIQIVEFFILSDCGKNYKNFLDFYNKNGPFGAIKYEGLISYLIGIAVSIPFMASAYYTGPIGKAWGGADFSYFVALIVAGGLYYISSKLVLNSKKQASKTGKASA